MPYIEDTREEPKDEMKTYKVTTYSTVKKEYYVLASSSENAKNVVLFKDNDNIIDSNEKEEDIFEIIAEKVSK